MKKTCEIPPSAFRPLPPPRRCNNGSKSIMLSEEEGFTSRVGDLNYKTRSYYFRMCKRVRPTNIESLPNELLLDILVRLPADYLYDRARFVCRRWNPIIHSHDFISTQIQHSSYGLLLHPSYQRRSHPIFVTATQGRIEKSEFSYKGRTCFLGSCNGLAMEFIGNKCKSVHIINPATKQPFTLPSFSDCRAHPSSCGVGYAPASMEYKVVVSYNNYDKLLCLRILTAGVDECWRYVQVNHLSDGDRSFLVKSPLITEGFMHWTFPCNRKLLTLNVETEILSVSEVPIHFIPETTHGYYFLSTGRSLTLLLNDGNNILGLLEMNSETTEWTRLADINLNGRLEQFTYDRLKPLGWVKYPEFLALSLSRDSCSTSIFYNLDTHEINTADLPRERKGVRYDAVVHKNNLQWLS